MPLSSKYTTTTTTTTTTPPLSPLSWNPSSVPPRKHPKKTSVHPVVVVAESIADGPEIEPSPLEDLRPEFDGFHDGSKRMRKRRPGRILVPESNGAAEFGYVCEFRCEEKDLEVEGSGYCVASRRGGSRHVMEDGYEVITNIHGDSKQAFFGVFDGHGGRAAVDTVSEKLGKNIIAAISETVEGNRLEPAIRSGYSTTDRDFISQGVGSGACVATALVKNRELYVSNAGDCRVVISRKGVASALTSDHIAGREDERKRIESLGGFMTCRNGIWRVHDSLAVSRAIGDANMKELVISEPETTNLRLTPDCEFLIIASDGLWDKVSNQEAVDVVLRHKGSIKSCKDLMDLSCRRGSRDDVTVMVVDLQSFVQLH